MVEREETVELLKMKKRISDLEAEVKNQRKALYMHLEQEEQGIEELKKIIESFKEVMQCILD